MTPIIPPLPPGHLLRNVQQEPQADGTIAVTLRTDPGPIRGRYHPSAAGDAAVLWGFGAGGGLGGLAGGVDHRLGRHLAGEGIASLELDYRRPADLAPGLVVSREGARLILPMTTQEKLMDPVQRLLAIAARERRKRSSAPARSPAKWKSQPALPATPRGPGAR